MSPTSGVPMAVRLAARYSSTGFAPLLKELSATQKSHPSLSQQLRNYSGDKSHPPSKDLISTIYDYSRRKQTGVSMKTLLDFGSVPSSTKLIQSADWLVRELPIRLARQIYYLDKLPYGLCLMPSVKKVRQWYVSSFAELYEFHQGRVQSEKEEREFTELITAIYERHSPTLITMAKGLYELKNERKASFGENDLDLADFSEIHQFLDSFYMSRIGLRMLISQHIELHKQHTQPVKNYCGIICKNTFPVNVAHDAIEDAKYMVTKALDTIDTPEVTIHGQTNLSFPYVPSHLYYMLFELLKNSMRATVETHKDKKVLPPIKIIIADSPSNEDVSIKISDEGGGIPRSNLNKIWSYLYSTAKFSFENIEAPNDFARENAPLAGLGYGLPLSRLYARYFGGDLQVISMENFGTDAYLHLHRIGDREEPLS